MKRVRIYEEKPSEAEIDKAVKVLRDGGIVIYPTDTVYALGCDALNVRAVERICQIKGINPQKVNLSIICRELSWVSEYAKLSNLYFKLLKRNLPGAFTFILPTSSSLPKIYKNRKTVGILGGYRRGGARVWYRSRVDCRALRGGGRPDNRRR